MDKIIDPRPLPVNVKTEVYFTDPDGMVTMVHSQPDQLTPERRAEGIEVAVGSEPPMPDLTNDQMAQLYVADGSLEWKVVDRPKTPQDLATTAMSDLMAMLSQVNDKLDKLLSQKPA